MKLCFWNKIMSTLSLARNLFPITEWVQGKNRESNNFNIGETEKSGFHGSVKYADSFFVHCYNDKKWCEIPSSPSYEMGLEAAEFSLLLFNLILFFHSMLFNQWYMHPQWHVNGAQGLHGKVVLAKICLNKRGWKFTVPQKWILLQLSILWYAQYVNK